MYHNLSIEDFAVLREFWDMFPKEILGLPPKRDINFTINLIPRFALVSKEPYQMSIPKLIELRMQLKELLDRGKKKAYQEGKKKKLQMHLVEK